MHRARADAFRELLDAPAELTIGVEEELTLTEALSFRPVAAAESVLALLSGDLRFCGELPADQIELRTPPLADAGQVETALASGRSDLAAVLADSTLAAAAGVHPLSDEEVGLRDAECYSSIRAEYGPIARRQVVCGLHVHVRLQGAERSLAVYNAVRSYLPEIAALAANAPYQCGRDTGFASIRPKISEGLPRQGVPPAFDSLDEIVADWAWGLRSAALASEAQWWWELRLHPQYGTIEVRVADQQITAGDSAAVAAVVHALVADLGDRFDAGEKLPVHPTWRIEQNRWSAARHGLRGTLADLDSGETRATRERVAELIQTLAPAAARLGAAHQLERAADLCASGGGAERLRMAAAIGGPVEAAALLAREFTAAAEASPAGVGSKG